LIALGTGWCASTYSGYITFLRHKTMVHKLLGRKLKWTDYSVAGGLMSQVLAWFFVNAVLLVAGWWTIGVFGTGADYRLGLAEVLCKLNKFSDEESVKLEKWAQEKQI